MKTSSKKRVLISSVAMLLVAMLALGTATYAWFTQDTRSYADQLSAQTSKVSSLVLSKSDRTNWQSHIQYGVENKIMYPASGNGTAWVYGNASDAVSGAIDNSTLEDALGTGTATDDYVFIEELNIKNAGAVAVNDVEITFSLSGTNSDYARVALVKVDAATTGNAAISSANVFAKTAEAYQPIINTTGTLGTSITPKIEYKVSVGNLDVEEAAYYKLYVWFEGQDKDCVDAKSGQKIPGLVFDVAGTPAED